MASEPHRSQEDSDRVVWLQPRRAAKNGGRADAPAPPVQDLGAYQRSADEDDFRHRMIVNGLALLASILLVLAGVWIANTMAEMRKNQDCVLSGRKACTPINVPPRDS